MNWNELLEQLGLTTSKLLIDLLIIIVVFVLAKLLHNALSRVTASVIHKAENDSNEEHAKELITGMTLLRSVSRYVIYFIAICIVINFLGYGSVASNMVAAAGIGALVISLGAQSIINDAITGFFIMFERQYAVGDYVRINDYEGTVTSLAMRCIYLRSWKGEKIVIPNGEIRTVINFSGEYNTAVVEVPLPYEIDLEETMKILQEEAEVFAQAHADICNEAPQVQALTSFEDSAQKLRVVQKVKGAVHWQFERELRLAIKKRLDQEGISIPYPQVVVHEKK